MKLVNANPAPQVTGREELPGKSHYYIGNDPKGWRTNVANYAQVEYEQVWSGINLVYYGNQRQLEYDFRLAPGADPQAIQLVFDGADTVQIDAQGNLVLHVAGGEVVLQKPFVYQEVNGARQPITGRYRIQNPKSKIQNPMVGFQVGEYDASLPLVIDPVLVYSTYLGSASVDLANDIAVDQAGNVYITGASFFSSEGQNAFVAKLNAAGTALVYSTAFIGSKDEIGYGVAVDASGNAYVTGFTRSTNFPVRNAFQPRLGATDCRNGLGCSDAFVAKLDAAGTIVYSTYLGGNDRPGDAAAFGDDGYDIAVDASGQAYVTGSTVSKNFPVKNAYQPTATVNGSLGNDTAKGFITKFSTSGSELIYSTYLGGNGFDACYGIAIDAAGNAYVTGYTNSFSSGVNNFPTTPNAFQRTAPPDAQNGFVTKLNASGNALVYSTFLGGNNQEQGEGIAVDSDGNAYIIGSTSSTNFPLESPHQSVNLGQSAFVTKLNASGSGLLYSSYLGKQAWSFRLAIAVDAAGNAYVTGSTTASDFPTVNALYPNFGGARDAYVAKINTVTKTVAYATFLGGSSEDRGYGIAVDAAGNVYVTGFTSSTDFPLKNPAQATFGGGLDVFVTKISNDTTCPPATLQFDSAAPEQAGDILTLSNVKPPDGDLVSGAILKRGGLKATVTYLLQSRDDAILDVTLFDQAGNIRYDFGTIPVKKPTTCPPKESAQDIASVASQLDLTPKDGIEVTSLRLTARLIASGGALIKRADVNYRVIPDAIAFDGTPKINGLDAANMSQLPLDGKVNFTCALRYHLTNDLSGTIRLQAFDANGGGQIASKDIGSKVTATAQPTIFNEPLDFRFDVLPNVLEISIVASLVAENGVVLKTSRPLFYNNILRIELGKSIFGQYNPLPPGTAIGAGVDLPIALAIKVKDDLPTSLRGSKFEVLLEQRLNDGKLIRGPKGVNFQQYDDFPRPSFSLSIYYKIPDDVDKWEFQLVISPPNNAPPIVSDVATLPIERVRIVPQQFIPARTVELERGKTEKFRYKLEYNVIRPSTSQLFARIEYNSLSGETPPPIKLRDLKPGDHSPPEPPFSDFDVMIPDNAKAVYLRVSFYLGTVSGQLLAESEPIQYDGFTQELQIPAGISSITSKLGVNLNGVQNDANRKIKLGRKGLQFKGFLGSLGLDKPANDEPRFAAAGDFSNRFAAVADPLRDFIGIAAFWQFDPPIPANSGFASNLIFSYDAEMLPDDPNFNEAAMKVIAFDPATGKLESYPTTIDLTAKTATARVNGLMPLYSLGVFGPFTHRTLNFPVLRSTDDFATRLNFASLGTASATLTARAFTPTGRLYNDQGIVNPLNITLPAARTLSGLASDLFKFNLPVDGGWIQTQADKNFIAGYQLLGKDNRLDGLGLPAFYAGTLVLTDIQYDATVTTEVHLANVTRFPTNVTLELRAAAGNLVERYETTLESKESFSSRIQDIFQAIRAPFSGYLLVRADADLAAAALLVSATELAALNGQVPFVSNTATKLYAPRIASDRNTTATWLNLVNPTNSTATLVVRAAGGNLAGTANLTLAPGQQVRREVGELFNSSPGQLREGALIVESSLTGVVGNLSYEDPSRIRNFRAALPLETEPGKSFAFAHADNRAGNFTRVSIFNPNGPNAQAANAEVKVFRADGSQAGAAPLQIAANGWAGRTLVELVAASANQAGGYFTLTADQPIVAAAVFGTVNGSTLSALPAQPLAAPVAANASVSAASFAADRLAPESIAAAFGANLATAVQSATSVPLPTSLAGSLVKVRDSAGIERPAPLFFVSPGQINYLLPAGTANGLATVTITSGDGSVSLGTTQIAAVAPGLFTANANGQGVPAAVALRVKADGAQSYESVARFDAAQNRFVATPIDLGPASDQVFLLLFGTGLRFNGGLAGVTCKLGGVDAPVSYAGAQGDLVGLDQVNLSVPRTLAGRGEVDLVLTVDGSAANTVRVAFAGGPICNYAITPASQSFTASGGAGNVNVTAPNGCAWTATSNANFITITSGASGTGNGTVNFTVAANSTTNQRTGTLTIAGQTFTVTQAALVCTYAIAPTSQSFNANANTGSVNVTANSGCAWTATSNANFLTITSGASGSGPGTVNYSVAANTATSQRTGTLTVAGQTFTGTQAAAAATVTVIDFNSFAPGTYGSTALAGSGITISSGSLLVANTIATLVLPTGLNRVGFFIGPGFTGTTGLHCTQLNFAVPLASFTVTRAGVTGGASFPAWRLRAFNSAGTQIGSDAGEGNVTSGGFLFGSTPTDFTVNAPGITRVEICSNNQSSSFSAVPLARLRASTSGTSAAAAPPARQR